MTDIFDGLRVGDLTLKNRIIMAPLTRMRSKQPGNIPYKLNAEYYGQRASAGLIISEATQISQQGQGYPATPGIYSDEQVEGWKKVTSAVHDKGGLIFLQLWHVGRISHPSLQPDSLRWIVWHPLQWPTHVCRCRHRCRHLPATAVEGRPWSFRVANQAATRQLSLSTRGWLMIVSAWLHAVRPGSLKHM